MTRITKPTKTNNNNTPTGNLKQLAESLSMQDLLQILHHRRDYHVESLKALDETISSLTTLPTDQAITHGVQEPQLVTQLKKRRGRPKKKTT